MRIFDISVPISPNMTVWPSHKPVEVVREKDMACGDNCNLSHLSCNIHTGTHIDAPSHFLAGGLSVDILALDIFLGLATVVDIPDTDDYVSSARLEQLNLPERTTRVLLKTKNSKLWSNPTHTFKSDYVYLTADGAGWLVRRGVKLVGIDYLSIEKFRDPGASTHRRLFEAGVVVLEGLNLSGVPAGNYNLMCLPLRIEGCDGAPARAVLTELDDEFKS